MFEKEAKEIAKDIYIHHFDDNINYSEVLNAITVGVQKGAELGAGRTKWHKVADGDLPEYGVEVLDENGDKVRYEMEGYAGYSGLLPSLSGWIAYSEYEERDVEIDTPIAWCEVPQYTEE